MFLREDIIIIYLFKIFTLCVVFDSGFCRVNYLNVSVLLYSYTYHMNIKLLHVLTLCVVSDGISVLICDHTDHINKRLLHAFTVHVLSGYLFVVRDSLGHY